MFSTPKKRLFELKKEVKALKKKMDKDNRNREHCGDSPVCYGLEYDRLGWSCYDIITSDGKCYGIDCTTRIFPDIDFRKVIYINKEFPISSWKKKGTDKWCSNKAWYDSYDSEIGFYVSNYSKPMFNREYKNFIRKKFPVKEFIYTGMD